MKLHDKMNFCDIDRWIISEMKNNKTRMAIEDELRKKFEWTDSQIFSTTDLHFEEKLYNSNAQRVRRA